MIAALRTSPNAATAAFGRRAGESAALPTSLPATRRRELEMQRKLGRKDDAQNPTVIHTAAAQMTSELFFAPLLAEMRRFPFGKGVGHGGRTEEIFGEQFDLRIADRIAAAGSGGLVAQLAARLTPRDSAGSIGVPPVRNMNARTHRRDADAPRFQDIPA
ncbi:hypothetical protein RAS1_29910 [Phycisphaerae bacterium RAS1]|nr:hypothetical protein RAS1_29910 [Phycisphaerae bacterium RAS1]